MKKFRHLLAFLLTLCLCVTMTTTAFAAESKMATNDQPFNYLNYEFPEDAQILYQSEDAVIYTTNTDSQMTRAVEHNQVWVDAGRVKTGSFTVTNPHPWGGTGECRLRLESNASNVSMNISVYAGLTVFLASQHIDTSKDIVFAYNVLKSDFVIDYATDDISSQHGMRLNCWLS